MNNVVSIALAREPDAVRFRVHFTSGETQAGVIDAEGSDVYKLTAGSTRYYFTPSTVVWIVPIKGRDE
jgi:hypothetical protein